MFLKIQKNTEMWLRRLITTQIQSFKPIRRKL